MLTIDSGFANPWAYPGRQTPTPLIIGSSQMALEGLSLRLGRRDWVAWSRTPASRRFQPARMSAQAKAGGSLENRNGGDELVAFSSVSVGDSVVRSFLTPARLVSSTHASLMAEARIDASSIHWFRLSPLARLR